VFCGDSLLHISGYSLRLRDFSLVHARHSTRWALNQGTTLLFGLITHCDTPALRENLALSCNMRADMY
jgi:hypothetical protein